MMPAHPHVSFFSEIRFMSGNFFGHAYTEITLHWEVYKVGQYKVGQNQSVQAKNLRKNS